MNLKLLAKRGVLSALCAGGLGIALVTPAQAQVTVTLDNGGIVTATKPTGGGTNTVYLSGTIQLNPGWTIAEVGYTGSYTSGGIHLSSSFTPEFLTYMTVMAPNSASFTGNLLSYEISSSTPEGVYNLGESLTSDAIFRVQAQDRSNNQITRTPIYEVTVGGVGQSAAPEPGSVLLLALGTLAGGAGVRFAMRPGKREIR